MDRPPLNKNTKLDDYFAFYWLKEELLQFCRQHQLQTSGSKAELSQRVAAFISGKPIPKAKKTSKIGSMPGTFSRSTVVGVNWRCSQNLRQFFISEIGPGFHFDETMRSLIHQGSGKTLGEIIRIWEESRQKPKGKPQIAPQFEYNRYIREYFQLHAQADFKDAVRAWNEHKTKRKA